MTDGWLETDFGDDDDVPDDDWYDDEPDDREPDPEDHMIAQAYEEYYGHCEKVHGGGECTCRPSPLAVAWHAASRRAFNAWYGARRFAREMHTVRLGSLELTVRCRPSASCCACQGRGWFYTKTSVDVMPMPEGYNGTALCGCGSAVARLAESRRFVRRTANEPPF